MTTDAGPTVPDAAAKAPDLGAGKIRVRVDGPVRTITLARPEARNALDGDMLDALVTLFGETPPPEQRVTVLRADGPVFCAGLDLKRRLAQDSSEWAGESPVEVAFAAVEGHANPVVAVVQGDAIAGGCELALHCDFVVASSRATFGMSLAQIGLAPTWFLTKKLVDVAGPVTTREILLLGEPVPAGRLAELGVISRCAAPHRIEVEVALLVDRLAANAPLSLRAIKAIINREMAFRDLVGHTDVDGLVDIARVSADAREGITARLEKRPPIFRGA